MARITAGIATSHVPAIGAALDHGRSQDEYWKQVFDEGRINRESCGIHELSRNCE